MDKAKLVHEDPPPTIKLPYLSVHFIVASPSCDLRNNVIGRSIGSSNDEAEMNVLALKVLDYFHT